MSESKPRRAWTAARKLRIVLETLGSDVKLAEVCRREGVSPNLVYKWRKQLAGSAEAIFARPSNGRDIDRRTAKLTEENRRMKDVIAEITAENLELKKTLSD
ncbi:MAG: transposase [Phycisphaerae bacterium]|nr:transposase [Phycisphaerae bacterium]